MMHSPKKIAMLIVRGLADEKIDSTESQEVKTPSEHEKKKEGNDDSTMGVEAAMKKFINAVHDKDCKKACDSLLEFIEMSEGYDYFDNEDKSQDKDDEKEE